MAIQRGTPRTTHQDHTPPTRLPRQWRFSGIFASPALPQSFRCCTHQGPAGRRGLGISPSKPTTGQARGARCTACIWHRPPCICKQQIMPAEMLPAEWPRRPHAARWATTVAPVVPSLGPHRHGPQQNHTPAVRGTALVKTTLSLTADSSSLEEFELNKLDLFAELQWFSVSICGYAYALLSRKKKNSLKIGIEDWKKFVGFTCASLEHFMTGFIK